MIGEIKGSTTNVNYQWGNGGDGLLSSAAYDFIPTSPGSGIFPQFSPYDCEQYAVQFVVANLTQTYSVRLRMYSQEYGQSQGLASNIPSNFFTGTYTIFSDASPASGIVLRQAYMVEWPALSAGFVLTRPICLNGTFQIGIKYGGAAGASDQINALFSPIRGYSLQVGSE